ncbi:MAG TPA: polyribonucleotide nucleotidyltransferase [Kosmotogaceae bacterium]|nr:MAG: Polyribonucleotide nucleotidyltransferase [Thermotogales bacterium 46_20]HAA85100.1 polyribonucleotide nucleotidyltransferase [Kosmotogaceae bacterium]
MNNYRIWKKELFGRELIVEHGKMARQASGAFVLRYADSMILVTTDCSDDPLTNAGFLPLTVEYQEKFYAAGKIPGGFIKREGRPSENSILSARIVDRSIRPLFPDDFSHEVQVIVTVLSADPDNPPDVWGIMGSSLALNVSRVPFDDLTAAVRVGLVDGEYIFFPTAEQLNESKMDIVVAGTAESVTMVEGEAKEVTEQEMLSALSQAHRAIQEIVAFQKEILASFNIEKLEFDVAQAPEGFVEAFAEMIDDRKILALMDVPGKHAKDRAFKEYRNELIDKYREPLAETIEQDQFDENAGFLKACFEERLKKVMRRSVVENDKRMDGRRHDEIRPISCELDLLPRAHGSALFTRGETQSLGIVTLGAPMDEQIVDTMFEEGSKRFMLHYNFPPFSTGETKRLRGPGRREIGHGHLAERGLKNVIPKDDEFPYTIRVVSEILESNGSSSMATVCSASLALMAAGVPIKKHVAGVAMGLIQEPDSTVVLTDILGNEDHFGDMDFKVVGTSEGITAFQMDVKIAGVTEEIMLKALMQARDARLSILEIMNTTISEPRSELSDHAPAIETISVPTEKVGELIGPGGKTIKRLSSEYDAEIFIDDAKGIVKLLCNNRSKMSKLTSVIEAIISDVKPGQVFEGKITRTEPYGVFVELAPGKTGLLHASKIGENIREFLKTHDVGSTVMVEVTGTDNMGRIQIKKQGVEVKEDDRRSDRRPSHRPPGRSDRDRGRDRK